MTWQLKSQPFKCLGKRKLVLLHWSKGKGIWGCVHTPWPSFTRWLSLVPRNNTGDMIVSQKCSNKLIYKCQCSERDVSQAFGCPQIAATPLLLPLSPPSIECFQATCWDNQRQSSCVETNCGCIDVVLVMMLSRRSWWHEDTLFHEIFSFECSVWLFAVALTSKRGLISLNQLWMHS